MFPELFNLENGSGVGGGGRSFTIIWMPKSSVLYGYTRQEISYGYKRWGYRMGMPGSGYPYSKLSKAGPSQYELSSRVQFLLFSKAFIALNVFYLKSSLPVGTLLILYLGRRILQIMIQ